MAQNSFALMTNLGRAKEAAALANSTAVVITHIAIGDGTTVPSGGETALYHEVARKAISGHGTVAGSTNVAYFDIFLAAAEGPYTIREAGLYDDAGDLIAIARYDPPINKPVPASGQTVEGTVRLEVAFSNIASVTIVVDPAFTVPLQRLSRLPWIPVLSMSVTAPPASPNLGDTYLVPTGATSAWAGQSGKIAEYTAAGWAIITPPDGHGIGLPDGRLFERVSGVYIEKLALDVQSGKWTYATAGGSVNALSITLNPAPSSWNSLIGAALRIKIQSDNTDTATLAISGLSGTKQIVRSDGSALQPSDLVAGQIAELIYDGSKVQLVSTGRASGGGAATSGVTTYSAGSHTYTVPDGVYRIECEVWGGGGGGGYAFPSANAGTGGGGGGYSRGVFDVNPGQQIPVIVGARGAGGTSSTSAQAGGTSSVSTLISATGGGGGAWENGGSSGPDTNAGGTGSGGQFNWAGVKGGGQFLAATTRIGGWGAPAFAGTWSGFNVADPGRLPGCGGGGGTAASSNNNGGPGAAGLIIIKTL